MTMPAPPFRRHTDGPPSGARALFRRLREIMAREAGAQARLDEFVRSIAANLVAEVCAIYLRRAGDTLELFAAAGLAEKAVHQTRLSWGEGLVGTIASTAQPLNLADAPNDPRFAYRPETEEDPFHAFLGVPIFRGGRLLGVLTIQNKAARLYSDDEVEALQTTAMILAEIAASGELVDTEEFGDVEEVLHRPERITGVGLAEGIGMGYAVFHEPPIGAGELFTDDIDSEQARLIEGVRRLRESVDALLDSPDLSLPDAPRHILETYRLFAYDRGWVERMEAAVGSGLTAEAAVERIKNENRLRMTRARDPYLRDRLHDLDDLAHRLLRHLAGDHRGEPEDLPDDVVLFARALGPADLLDFDRSKLRGVVLGEGSAASHVAIVARAIGVPLIGRAGVALDEIDPGDFAILDGAAGEIRIRPTSEEIGAFTEQVEFRTERQKAFAREKDAPAHTRDGVEMSLLINAGLKVDLPHLERTGADGIGLFRTELQFMVAPGLPRLRAQTDFYRSVFEACAEKPIVFRTVDLGGDKVLPYLRTEREANPAMGWRAIRFALDRPALLRYQLRALLEAAQGRVLNVMFPMIAVVEEFEAAKALLDREIARADRQGRERPAQIRIGAMIEVPSIAMQIDDLLPMVDFVSIGGNDLAQFFFAADRENARVQKRYDPLHPSFLRLVESLVQKTDAAGVELSFCGEQAGRPLEALALACCGVRRLSTAATAIGPVKAALRSADIGAISEELTAKIRERAPVRATLNEIAQRHGVNL